MSINREKAIQFLQSLIRTNSINPPGNELETAQKIAEYALAAGLEADIRALEENRANVIVTLKGYDSENCPALLFSGHMDTVPVGNLPWQVDPLSGEKIDGKIYGRGASDMKGGIAASIEAMILLKESGHKFKGDIIFAGSAGEEVDCCGAHALVENQLLENAGAIIIAEPSNGKVFSAHKGALWLEIETYGKTAHCSMPNEGVNAVLHMSELINRLKEYQFGFTQKHRLLGEPTLVISSINGGVSTNVVPDHCKITVDIRTIPEVNHTQVIDDIHSIIKSLENEFDNFKASLRVKNNLPSIECEEKNIFVETALRVNEELTGVSQPELGVNYFTEGSVFSVETEAPIIIYGPGDEKLAHQPNEYVEINKFFAAIDFYAVLAKKYFQLCDH
jgi:succinyl-diaminopimelate desuccinylase